MMPVRGIDDVHIQWLKIEKSGYKLYGFLIYTGADTTLVEYLREGIYDLDVISGKDCAIFLIEPPSKKWLRYAQKRKHPWLDLFPQPEPATHPESVEPTDLFSETARILIAGNAQSTIIVGNGNHVTLGQLVDTDYDELYDRSDAFDVAKYFNLSYGDIPCIVFFKHINSRVIWKESLVTFSQVSQLTQFFRSFFSSADFSRLISEE